MPLEIPSPPINGVDLGPIRLHFYALCILAGIVIAAWLAARRWRARGGKSEDLEPVLVWAIALGFVGARLYHVITDYQLYFGPGRNPWEALMVWRGGLGIWGAVALGGLGAWIACRRSGLRLSSVADAIAPTLLIAQAIGRLGNWFNQELFGRPTDLPWALAIDPAYRPPGFEQFATFHPTFLYELLWNLAIAGLLIWADRRFRLGHGVVFWLYVAGYTAGRMWIEHLRIDTVNTIGGFRLNEYTSWIVFAVSVVIVIWLLRRRPGREDSVYVAGEPEETSAAEGEPAEDDADAGVAQDATSDDD